MKCCEYNQQGPYRQHVIFLIAYQWANKLECYIILDLKGLLGTNTLAYNPILKLRRKLSVLNTTPETLFTTLHSLHSLPMGQ
jgi:hypothetical protein